MVQNETNVVFYLQLERYADLKNLYSGLNRIMGSDKETDVTLIGENKIGRLAIGRINKKIYEALFDVKLSCYSYKESISLGEVRIASQQFWETDDTERLPSILEGIVKGVKLSQPISRQGMEVTILPSSEKPRVLGSYLPSEIPPTDGTLALDLAKKYEEPPVCSNLDELKRQLGMSDEQKRIQEAARRAKENAKKRLREEEKQCEKELEERRKREKEEEEKRIKELEEKRKREIEELRRREGHPLNTILDPRGPPQAD